MSHIEPSWANVLLFPSEIEDIGVEAMREVEENVNQALDRAIPHSRTGQFAL